MEQPVHDDLAAARLAWAQWRSVSMDSAFAAVISKNRIQTITQEGTTTMGNLTEAPYKD